MNIIEAKKIIRVAYNNGEISEEVMNAHKEIIKHYEKLLDSKQHKSVPWTIEEEKLLVKMHSSQYSMDDMCKALGRSSRAIEKRLHKLINGILI